VLTPKQSNQFKKDAKRAYKRGKALEKLDDVVLMLLKQELLPVKYRDHNLTGNWVNHRECHIEPDWLLIYYVDEAAKTLTLVRTGTHADLFEE
jgi:mRNA interferase YafQ